MLKDNNEGSCLMLSISGKNGNVNSIYNNELRETACIYTNEFWFTKLQNIPNAGRLWNMKLNCCLCMISVSKLHMPIDFRFLHRHGTSETFKKWK